MPQERVTLVIMKIALNAFFIMLLALFLHLFFCGFRYLENVTRLTYGRRIPYFPYFQRLFTLVNEFFSR